MSGDNKDQYKEYPQLLPYVSVVILSMFKVLIALVLMSIVYHLGAPLWFAVAFFILLVFND